MIKVRTGNLKTVALVALTAGIVALGLSMAMRDTGNQQPSSSSKPKTASPISDTADNKVPVYKTYTLKNEKLSFKYLADWQLKDNSTPGRDSVVLTKNGFRARIETGDIKPEPGYTPKVLRTVPVKVAGQSVFMNFVASKANDNLLGMVYVSRSQTNPLDFPLAKNVNGVIAITAGYDDDKPALTLEATAQDQQYLEAAAILSSMRY